MLPDFTNPSFWLCVLVVVLLVAVAGLLGGRADLRGQAAGWEAAYQECSKAERESRHECLHEHVARVKAESELRELQDRPVAISVATRTVTERGVERTAHKAAKSKRAPKL